MIIESGDKVEVKGAKTTFAANPAIIAAKVKKGDDLFELRDDDGFRFGVAGSGGLSRRCISHNTCAYCR